MNKLKQLIAEVRYGESELDRANAYKEALAMVDAKESLIAQPTLTTAEFKRFIESMGKFSVSTPDFGGITVVERINKEFFDRITVAIIGEKDHFQIQLLDKKALEDSGCDQSEIDDICGLIWEYAATPIEKRKEEK